MSAYVVDRAHINYLVNSALHIDGHDGPLRWRHNREFHRIHIGKAAEATAIGQMLWDECIASVRFRYPDDELDDLPGPIGEDFIYEYKPDPFTPWKPVEILSACDCYDYQSCEHPDWNKSEAKAFIDALRSRAWHRVPGYDAAAWGAPESAHRPYKTIEGGA